MPHERSAQRVDQANGYKSKTMLTRMGEITFEVPQVRSGGGFTPAWQFGLRRICLKDLRCLDHCQSTGCACVPPRVWSA